MNKTYVRRLFAPQIFPNKTRHTPLQSTGCYLGHSAIHKTTVLHSSFKNVHFPCPGWIFLFFCKLQDVLIPVYILRLQSIVLKLHTTDANQEFQSTGKKVPEHSLKGRLWIVPFIGLGLVAGITRQ